MTPVASLDHLAVPFTDGSLASGLRVIVHEDRSEPVVAVHLMVHVGSRHEPPGRTGFAHLFEHLLFQGSAHVPAGEHFRLVQDAGGMLNGSTSFDRTNYFEVLPSNALEVAVWLESDRLGWFLPALDAGKFETQRGVVQNERRQRYENQPYGLWFEELLGLLFPPDHPYGHPTIGSMADLEQATLDDARDFFQSFYQPANVTLVVAGHVEEGRARALVERYFGEIPSGPAPEPPETPAVALDAERHKVICAPVEVPRIYIGYHAPRWKDSDSLALAAAAAVLAGHRGARLARELVYRDRIAQECMVTKFQEIEAAGLVLAVVTGKPGVETEALLAAYDREVDRLAGEGPTEEETRAAKRLLRLAVIRRLEAVGGRADALAHAAVLLDDPGFVETQQEWIEEIEGPAVQAAAAGWLGRPRAVVAYEPENRG